MENGEFNLKMILRRKSNFQSFTSDALNRVRSSMNHKMPSESKPLLTTQTEKPNHYSYLKEFRVDQCPLFLQHKCTQHRPYTCFHWHFMNQRRRRPVRKRDGSFNYSADNYCTKFDETTGLCPEGDECPYLHRTAGDTERRYHLRYYKTCMCVHDTDSRGFCVKNGPHCAFAHGNHDLRPPVYDIKEIQALENPDGDANATPNGPNVLDKERNLMNEDPKWQDSTYVLSNYKTEPCKRPPRLCRQGYACPQYHNSRDKRRSPKKFKYRSTPCPNVKHGDEWGEPSNCESGDNCAYCHTRTEQQFHPEIYKSTKCNDVQQAGYCPRGAFCAFAHIDQEMSVARDADIGTGTNLSEILSNALPPDSKKEDQKSESSNGSGEASESASISSIGSNSSNKAPGAQLSNTNKITQSIFNNHNIHSNHDIFSNSLLQQQQQQIMAIDSPLLGSVDKLQRKQSMYFSNVHTNGILGSFYSTDTVESVVGNALEDLNLDEPLNLVASIDRDLERESPAASSSISASLANTGLLGSSAPVNIPGSSLSDRNSSINFSPTASSPLNHLNFLGSRYSQDAIDSNTSFMGQSHLQSKMGNFQSTGIYDFSQNMSPHHAVSHSPLVSNFITGSSPGALSNNEIQRLQNEVLKYKQQVAQWEQMVARARTACEAWQRDAEENSRKANIAEKQRDEALNQAKNLQKEVESLQKSPFLHGLRRVSELRTLTMATLKQLQAQLRADLEEIEKEIYLQTATKCMVCEDKNRSVTLGPCNHYVLCTQCAPSQKECPYCQTPIQSM